MTAQDNPPEGMAERELLLGDYEPKRSGLRKFLWVMLILVVSLSLAVLVTSFVLDYRGSSELGAAYAAARAAGVPVNYSDPFYRKWDTQRPASAAENAAVSYEKAFRLLAPVLPSPAAQKVPYLSETEFPDYPYQALPPDMVSSMRDLVWMSVEAFDLLHEGAKAPGCYFPIEWKGAYTEAAHLGKARSGASLIAARIALDGEEGHSADAIEAIEDGLALAAAIGKEPMLISQIVSTLMGDTVLSGATRFLARTDPTNDEFVTLQNAFSSAAESLSLRPALVGEIAMQQDTYDRFMRGELPIMFAAEDDGANRAIRMPAVVRAVTWLVRGHIKSDRARCLEEMLKAVAVAEKPTPATISPSWAGWAGWYRSDRVSPFQISYMLLPSVHTPAHCENWRAKLLAAAASCAAMRYRNDTGHWPKDLDALVPEYLDAVPTDPFTGQPMVYRVDIDGVMVYSVGRNLNDDLGRPGLLIRSKSFDEQRWRLYDDAGFKVWKAAEGGRGRPDGAPSSGRGPGAGRPGSGDLPR